MGDKSRVRPGLSSPDQSQDVEFTIDKQIDDGQHERDKKESGGPLGPPKTDKRFKSIGKQPDVVEQPVTPDLEKQHRAPFSWQAGSLPVRSGPFCSGISSHPLLEIHEKK